MTTNQIITGNATIRRALKLLTREQRVQLRTALVWLQPGQLDDTWLAEILVWVLR